MTTTILLKRSAALLASGGVAVALALIPSGAHAKVKGEYYASASAEARYVGSTSGGTCDLSSGDDDVTTSPTVFGHGTKHKSVNLNATFSSSDNASDQVTVSGHLTSSLTLKKSHNDLKVFDLQDGGTVKVSHTTVGSHCQGSGTVIAVVEEVLFTEHKKGTLTLTRDVKKPDALSEFILYNIKTDQEVAVDLVEGGSTSHAVSTATLKPGQYAIVETGSGIFSAGGGVPLKSAPLTSKVAMSNELHAVFTPAKKHHHHHH